MRTSSCLALSLLTAALFGSVSAVSAQQAPLPDSLRGKMARLALPLILTQKTVVALYPYAVFDSAARLPDATARNHPEIPRLSRVADSLGFDFVLRPPETATIQDERYAATYQAPSGRKAGLILFAPGLRPMYLPPGTSDLDLARQLSELALRASRMAYRPS